MQLLQALSEGKLNFDDSLELLRNIEISDDQGLAFQMLQHRNNLHDSTTPILNSILVSKGYYPYLDIDLNSGQGIAQEFHKSENIPFTFHREQRKVLTLLNEKKPVILCAPTSFGKSLLIEEIVASDRYNHIVIIQPTLALLDETRKKLRAYDTYKIIFSKSQIPGNRNIYLLTAERFVEFPGDIEVDFFIIDEFYKLDLEGQDRKDILNLAFYRLLKKTSQFYMLGPQVKIDSKNIEKKAKCEFIDTSFKTVGADVSLVGEQTLDNLINSLKNLEGQSLVYTRSPDAAEGVAAELSKETKLDVKNHEDFISWCSSNVHPNWSLYSCLRSGVGFHHAQMPRYVGNYVVEAFNRGHLKMLVCTSTLMEGVNTSAKNVLIYHLLKGSVKLNALDVRNMSGRAGRMRKYFVGRVLIFTKELKLEEPELIIPSLEPEKASNELIIQMQDADLSPIVKERVEKINQSSDLPMEVLKKHAGIPIDSQIKFFNLLSTMSNEDIRLLIWNGYPDWDKLLAICTPLFQCFKGGTNLIRTGKELATYVSMYQRKKNSAAVINHLITSRNEPVDKAIRETFGRIRGWFEFRLPKLLLTAQEIISLVATRKGISIQSLDYSFYATALENGFLPPGIGSLRELGIPVELLKKLSNRLDLEADPEIILKTLKRLSLETDLHPYEVHIIKEL